MAEHLMSVRFDGETLTLLRTLAEVHDTNVAEEIRTAVGRYITEVREDPAELERRLEAANQDREERVKQLLGR